MTVAAKVETAVVTKAELSTLAALEARYAEACRLQSEVERSLKSARLALAEKVLGVDVSKELRLMHPENVEKLMSVRQEKGLWKLQRGAPPFVFLKTNEGRYPSWKELYVSEHGEAAADKILAETPKFYSYRVDVAL